MTGPVKTVTPVKRPARGRTVESPRHETEARQAAAAIDARRPVGALSPYPTAALRGPAGPGAALPPAIRHRLEAGFNADLSDLRVHSGPEAAALARGENARAFAAGQHLVFAEGAYRPQEATGLRLIAHETAHAIQQSAADNLPAQHVAPQRDPDKKKDKAEPPKIDPWIDVLDFHLRAANYSGTVMDPEDPDFKADLAAMKKVIGTESFIQDTSNDVSKAFAKAMLDKPPKSFRGRCLAYDVLHFAGEYDAALEFLLKYPYVETWGEGPKFTEYLIASTTFEDAAVVFIDKERSADMRVFWEDLVARQEKTMLDPGAGPPGVSPIQTFLLGYNETRNKFFEKGEPRLGMNSLQQLFLIGLSNFENSVRKTARKKSTKSDILGIINLADAEVISNSPYMNYLRRLFALDAFVNHDAGENPAIIQPIRERLQPIIGDRLRSLTVMSIVAAREAQNLTTLAAAGSWITPQSWQLETANLKALNGYWDDVVDLAGSASEGALLELLSFEAAGLGKAAQEEDDPAKLSKYFRARLPAQDELIERRQPLLDKIAALRDGLATELADARVSKPVDTVTKLDKRGTILMALIWTDWFADWLAAKPIGTGPDARALYRFDVAIALHTAGVAFDHSDLRAATEGVVKAEGAGVSYAIIPDGYEKMDGADYHDMARASDWLRVEAKGKSDKAHVGRLPISVNDLIKLYDILELRAVLPVLAEEIERQSEEADKRLGQTPEEEEKARKLRAKLIKSGKLKGPPAPNLDALYDKVVADLEVPVLYEAAGGRIVKHPDDVAWSAAIQLRHPDAATFFAQVNADLKRDATDNEAFFLRDGQDLNRVYFWAIPSLEPVWEELLFVPALTDLMEEWEGETALGDDATALQKLHDFQLWLESRGEETSKETETAIRDYFREELDYYHDSLTQELRNLTAVNRKITRDNIIDTMTAYGDDNIKKILIADKFGDYIRDFSMVVKPAEDRELQVALLMLEAAPQIEALVKEKANYDAINFLLPPVSLALTLLSGQMMNQTRAAELKTGEDKVTREGFAAEIAKLKPFGLDMFATEDDAAHKDALALALKFVGDTYEGDTVTEQLLALRIDMGHNQLLRIMGLLLEARHKAQADWKLYASRSKGMHTEQAGLDIKPGSDNAMFIMALWSEKDVSAAPGEGDWYWPKDSEADSPVAALRATPEEKAKREAKPGGGMVGTNSPWFYNLEKIHRSFEYIPSYNAQDQDARAKGGAYYPGGKTKMPDGKKLVTLTVAPIIVTGSGDDADMDIGEGRTVDIYSDDIELLDLLASVIDSHSRATQLAGLAEGVETALNFLLDLAEFIPGIGQFIMLARLGVAAVEVMQNLNWDELKEELVDAPREMVFLIRDLFMAELNSETLWWLILAPIMGDARVRVMSDALTEMRLRSRDKARANLSDSLGARRGRNKKTEKYKKFAAAVASIGWTFADAILALQNKAENGVDRAVGKLMMSPILVGHLSQIDKYAIWVALGADMAKAAADTAGGIEGLFGDEASDREAPGKLSEDDATSFDQAIQSMVAPIRDFELPEEILPEEILVEIVLELALYQVMKKNKKLRVVFELLRLSGAFEVVAAEIKEHLLPDELSPNKLWRDEVRSKLEEPFNKGRKELVDGLYGAINWAMPHGHKVSPPPPEQHTLGAGDLTIAEDIGGGDATPPEAAPEDAAEAKAVSESAPLTEPFQLAGDPRHPHPGWMPPGEGRPLPKTLLHRMQDGFGHDLSHVRLHDDPSDAEYVAATGAEALASGSHIYLGDRVDPESHEGDHILRHEVAHVLQQTGPRPLDGPVPGGARPKDGRAGRGLEFHAGREADAERMAMDSQRHDGPADHPMPVKGRGEVSLAPFGRGDMIRVLYELGRQVGSGDYAERVTGGLDVLEHNGRTALAHAKQVFEKVDLAVSGGTWSFHRKFLLDSAYIPLMRKDAGQALAELDTATKLYEKLANRAASLRSKLRRKPRDHFDLDPKGFLTVLEGYIYDRSGIRLNLDIVGNKPSGAVSVQVRGVHLGRVRAGNRGFYNRIKKHNKEDADKKGFKMAKARAYLGARFPLPHDWDLADKELVLPKSERDKAAGYRKATKAKVLPAADLPPWDDYVKPDGDGLGLRVGTHDELTGHDTSTRTVSNIERESHHLPQFLLAEFYAGASKTNPEVSVFGSDGAYWTPGFTGGSTADDMRPTAKDTYTGFTGGGATIDFDPLNVAKNRGAGMPAISLARETHREGGLHLNASNYWDDNSEGKKSKIQGWKVRNQHEDALITHLKPLLPQLGLDEKAELTSDLEDRANFKAIVDHANRANTSTRRELLKTATYKAMRDNYEAFVDQMLPALKDALNTLERPYYARLAGEAHTDGDGVKAAYQVPTGDAWKTPVITALKEKNKQIYGQWFVEGAWS